MGALHRRRAGRRCRGVVIALQFHEVFREIVCLGPLFVEKAEQFWTLDFADPSSTDISLTDLRLALCVGHRHPPLPGNSACLTASFWAASRDRCRLLLASFRRAISACKSAT